MGCGRDTELAGLSSFVGRSLLAGSLLLVDRHGALAHLAYQELLLYMLRHRGGN